MANYCSCGGTWRDGVHYAQEEDRSVAEDMAAICRVVRKMRKRKINPTVEEVQRWLQADGVEVSVHFIGFVLDME